MNKKIIKDALILFVITLIAGFALGYVHNLTQAPIAAAKSAAAKATYGEVYPEAADFRETEALTKAVKGCGEALAAENIGNVSVDGAREALDASGNVIGYLVDATSKEGYNGTVQISLGISLEGKITGIGFLAISETPGLGMKAKEPAFRDQFKGLTAQLLTLVKGGQASGSTEVEAISGASYTSGAVTGACNAAIWFVNSCIG